MSIRVTLNCLLNTEKYDQLLSFLETNLPNVRGFEGCLRVTVLFNDEKTEMLLEEDWLSVEAHQGYLGFIEKNGVLGQLATFLQSPPEIKYFEVAEL